jgi:hypothetical protein
MVLLLQPVISLILAYVFHWTTNSLIWSLWISSLLTGWTMIFMESTFDVREKIRTHASAGVWFVTALGILIGNGFILFHFTFFHFVHSMFLQSLFPPSGVAHAVKVGAGSQWPDYLSIFKQFWIVALVAIGLNAFNFIREPKKIGTAEKRIYGGVIRIHLLIFMLFFAKYYKVTEFQTYAIVVIMFLPYQLLWRSRRDDDAITDDKHTDKAA